MKKLLCILLLLMLIPVFSVSESAYVPKFNMTIKDFIAKYNAIGAPFDTPLTALTTPYRWTTFNQYNVAWLSADNENGATILLLSEDTAHPFASIDAGLDRIQIFMTGPDHFLPFVSVGRRCASLFAADIFTYSTSHMVISQLLTDYYENNSMAKNQSYFRQIDPTSDIYMSFFITDNYYYFDIYTGADNN